MSLNVNRVAVSLNNNLTCHSRLLFFGDPVALDAVKLSMNLSQLLHPVLFVVSHSLHYFSLLFK